MGFPGGSVVKESACQCRRRKRRGFDPWLGKIPWRRKWQPTPVSLPRTVSGQKSLEGYSPWSRKELDMTQCEHKHASISYMSCPHWAVNTIGVRLSQIVLFIDTSTMPSTVHGTEQKPQIFVC